MGQQWGFKTILIYMRQHAHVKICLMTILNINFQMFSVRGPCDPLYDRKLVEGFCHSLPHRPSVVSGRCLQVVFLHRSYDIRNMFMFESTLMALSGIRIYLLMKVLIFCIQIFVHIFPENQFDNLNILMLHICPSIFDKK